MFDITRFSYNSLNEKIKNNLVHIYSRRYFENFKLFFLNTTLNFFTNGYISLLLIKDTGFCIYLNILILIL